MLAALQGCPPRRTERQYEAGRCHEPREYGGFACLVGRLPRAGDGTVHAPLRLLLRNTCALCNQLGKVGPALGREAATCNGRSQDAGDLGPSVVGAGWRRGGPGTRCLLTCSGRG